jgi:hypothetical protein
VGHIIIRQFKVDVGQDLHIWENKQYVIPPSLAEGDGPVGAYRKWSRQFYPDGTDQPRGRLRVANG